MLPLHYHRRATDRCFSGLFLECISTFEDIKISYRATDKNCAYAVRA